jgi:Domain of unknown function (DUF4159)
MPSNARRTSVHPRPPEARELDCARDSGASGRRDFLKVATAALSATVTAAYSGSAHAYGDDGTFEPKVLLAGGLRGPAWASAPKRWCSEVDKRTSAPARSSVRAVAATDPLLLDGPLAYWSGSSTIAPLSAGEMAGMRQFLALGGLLVVDDSEPDVGTFGRDARRELSRVLPEAAPVAIPVDHVVYRSFYLLKPARPFGRKAGPPSADAIMRAGVLRVVFLAHDMGGAMARNELGTWQASVDGGDEQREKAIRFAVNLALYALTTNYKDDAVHAKFLLQRRAAQR